MFFFSFFFGKRLDFKGICNPYVQFRTRSYDTIPGINYQRIRIFSCHTSFRFEHPTGHPVECLKWFLISKCPATSRVSVQFPPHGFRRGPRAAPQDLLPFFGLTFGRSLRYLSIVRRIYRHPKGSILPMSAEKGK